MPFVYVARGAWARERKQIVHWHLLKISSVWLEGEAGGLITSTKCLEIIILGYKMISSHGIWDCKLQPCNHKDTKDKIIKDEKKI